MKKVMIQPSVIMRERDYETAFELWSLTEYVTSWSIVGWELTEITNACGVPRSTAKQENELTSAF